MRRCDRILQQRPLFAIASTARSMSLADHFIDDPAHTRRWRRIGRPETPPPGPFFCPLGPLARNGLPGPVRGAVCRRAGPPRPSTPLPTLTAVPSDLASACRTTQAFRLAVFAQGQRYFGYPAVAPAISISISGIEGQPLGNSGLAVLMRVGRRWQSERQRRFRLRQVFCY